MKHFIFILTFVFLNQAPLFAKTAVTPLPEDAVYTKERRALVEQLKRQNIKDPVVLAAIEKVQRHEFVPEKYRKRAYENISLPVGPLQVISEPHMVALMTEAIRPRPGQKVLEIGTASGYQAAVLAEIVDSVYTIEIVDELARSAAERLKHLGYTSVHSKSGDGFFGWPEAAPFDGIIVTCSADKVPPMLAEQLKEGGRIVIPLGGDYSPQTLAVITKKNGQLVSRPVVEVQFVPMVGEIKK
jgi:protein-L-isoaspartate(D-aspartate) O-methyltransferase